MYLAAYESVSTGNQSLSEFCCHIKNENKNTPTKKTNKKTKNNISEHNEH